jgi:hypothetical protein
MQLQESCRFEFDLFQNSEFMPEKERGKAGSLTVK